MGIVFCLPLAPGLFALAVDLPVNLDEAYAGLVLPASAYVLMGKSGVHRVCTLAPRYGVTSCCHNFCILGLACH